ncbi:hypothetical protein [Streptomyces sp. NPDC001221]
MTRIEEILSRALLVRERTVPRDIVPPSARTTRGDAGSVSMPPPKDSSSMEAAEDLRALCETLVTHTPASAVAEFVTDQVPEPRSALVLACVLQLTDTDDGARYWWQYAAGAGQPAAAYCLYLHHLALGESNKADWWHRQTDDVQPRPELPFHEHASRPQPPGSWYAAEHRVTSTSTTTILRVLRHLAKHTARPRTGAVTELMAYLPTAVAAGYLHQPDMELPMPGSDFARKVRILLATAANKPDAPNTLPARPDHHDRVARGADRTTSGSLSAKSTETVHTQMGETATR